MLHLYHLMVEFIQLFHLRVQGAVMSTSTYLLCDKKSIYYLNYVRRTADIVMLSDDDVECCSDIIKEEQR
jgi:hypothetical protein